MDDQMRASVSALLEAIVTADGVIRPEERDFVRRAVQVYRDGRMGYGECLPEGATPP